MISGIKNNPHGASFKAWAAKCTKAFKDRNICVTTKHTYEITYKYIWQCTSPVCGQEYKRHSKSIDPVKHSCGKCKTALVQIKPVPRKVEGVGEYQAFIKREHARVKTENPNAKFGEIMAILGREYKENKMQGSAVEGDTVTEFGVPSRTGDGDDVGDVASKLDSLNLSR